MSSAERFGTDAREAEIIGKPPRILPLTGVDAAAAIAENTRRLRRDVLGDDGPMPELADIPEIVPTMMRQPELWDRICDLSIQLQARRALDPRGPAACHFAPAVALPSPIRMG